VVDQLVKHGVVVRGTLGVESQNLTAQIAQAQALHNVEGLAAVGSAMTLDVRREGKPLQIKATLKEQARAVSGDSLDPRLGGATFVDLPESLRQSGAGGVMVSEVKRGSRAASNGLQPGDIITDATVGEFADLASWRANFQQRPPTLVLRILRNNGQQQGQLVMR
jgi:S1-C subfamily serine protease